MHAIETRAIATCCNTCRCVRLKASYRLAHVRSAAASNILNSVDICKRNAAVAGDARFGIQLGHTSSRFVVDAKLIYRR